VKLNLSSVDLECHPRKDFYLVWRLREKHHTTLRHFGSAGTQYQVPRSLSGRLVSELEITLLLGCFLAKFQVKEEDLQVERMSFKPYRFLGIETASSPIGLDSDFWGSSEWSHGRRIEELGCSDFGWRIIVGIFLAI